MKKKIVILTIILIVLIGVYFLVSNTDEIKLKNAGYNKKEIKLILSSVEEKDYELFLNYDKSLIDIISSKNYKEKNFKKYIEYYQKNKKSNIDDIITIVNSKYDLKDYPASSLLASLTIEKYYIYENTARYLDYANENKKSAKETIKIVNANADKPFYSETHESNLNDDNLILVNKYYHLNEDYEPNDLTVLPSNYNKGLNSSMRKEAKEAFIEMANAALLDNITIKNASAYRNYTYQKDLYDKYVKKDGKEKADIYSARPGYSEHQTGLCTDINTVDSSFDNTKESNWLKKNAYKYGFILRFPKDKENITGYKYESWHYRYVGKKASKIIKENDLTLEEYYAYYVEKRNR